MRFRKNKKKHTYMEDHKEKNKAEETVTGEETRPEIEDVNVEPVEGEPVAEGESDAAETLAKELEATQAALEKEKKEYLFLMADFDNFRKRVMREKADLIKNGAEKAFAGLLPIVDDFERGLAAIKDSTDAESVKEGMNLIYNKLVKYLEQNGVKAMESTGADFDAELHEAIATIPAPAPEQKGKVIDTTTKGYMINDKVLRHAKVVVGE